MADLPLAALGGRTPLAAAEAARLNALSARGRVGQADTSIPGLPVASDTAFLSLLGLDPARSYTGRAPLEAAGLGIPLSEGDRAVRCNLVSLTEGGVLSAYDGGGLEGGEARALARALTEDPVCRQALEKLGWTLYPQPSFRQLAVCRGCTAELPPPDGLIGRPAPSCPALAALLDRTRAVLAAHPVNLARRSRGKPPVNGLWPWGGGQAARLADFRARYGVRGCCVTAVPLVAGIARLTGLELLTVEGATGELDTNYAGKAEAACAALGDGCEFALIHVEAPDACAHRRDPAAKTEAVRRIDRLLLPRLLEGLEGERVRLLVLSDHLTLTETGAHGAGPVPWLLYDSGRPASGPARFDEETVARGPLLAGAELMPLLLQSELT